MTMFHYSHNVGMLSLTRQNVATRMANRSLLWSPFHSDKYTPASPIFTQVTVRVVITDSLIPYLGYYE